MPVVLYEAGVDQELPYRMSLDTIRAGLSELRCDVVCRFMEFWCQKNCVGPWRVQETEKQIHIWFEMPRDVIIFKLSSEYDDFVVLGARAYFPQT